MADARDVFIVCNNIEELGGVQRWAHHLAGLLTGRGHRVRLIGIRRPPDPHDLGGTPPYGTEVLHRRWDLPAMRWRPARPLDHLDLPARLRDRRRAAAVRWGATRLSELFAGSRPGGVVIVAQIWAMEWVRSADTRGLKVIGMSHESYRASRRSSRHARIMEDYAEADRLLALTAEDADAWARAGMTNADHLPNPLHVTPRAPAEPPDRAVMCAGRLSREKGVDMALRAWALVSPRHPEWRLRLYGSGAQERALRRLAVALGIAPSVEFRGVTGDIEGALARSAVFALPSREEGFPMSVMEAMAHGLPTVAFDCAPGVRELLTHETDALLVRPGDIPAFGAALDLLMDDADLRARLGAAARESVLRFHPDGVLDRWERLFDLLNRERATRPARDAAALG